MSQNFSNISLKRFFKSFFVIGVGKSLFIWFLAISFIPLASVSFINYLNSYLGLTIIVEKSLITTSQLRIEHINNYFEQKVGFLEFESNQTSTIDFFTTLSKNLNRNTNSTNIKYADRYLSIINNYKIFHQRGDFNNIHFLNKEGILLFSLIKEFPIGTDFSRNIEQNKLLSKVFNNTLLRKTACFSDVEYSESKPKTLESFLTYPVLSKTNELIGIIALNIDISVLNSILVNKADMGETGESYIIGKDLYYRSISRFNKDNVILKKKSTHTKSLSWLNYITHQNDEQYLSINELDNEKTSTYQNSHGKNVLGIYRNLYYLQKLGVNWALLEEIEHDEAFAYAKQLSDIAKIAFIVTIIIVFFVSIFVTRWFVDPIKRLSSWTKQVALGELVHHQIRTPKNEVGEMVFTFNSLVKSLQSYADVSHSVSIGDYTKSVEIRSSEDVLGKSMNKMVESFKNVVQQANKIANGDYSADIEPRSDKDTLGIALYEMTGKLRSSSKEINDQDWLKSGINEMGQHLEWSNRHKTFVK